MQDSSTKPQYPVEIFFKEKDITIKKHVISAKVVKQKFPTWISLYDSNRFMTMSAVNNAGSPINNFILSNSYEKIK